jgi:hypothetical protein
VAVGADQSVEEGGPFATVITGHHGGGQVLQVHLVHDAGGRRNDLEVVERFLAPVQELVALHVALELQPGVEADGIQSAEGVDLHGVVDHQVDRHDGVDLLGIATQPNHGVAQGGQVDHAGHTGEVLQHHACGDEVDLHRVVRLGIPVGQILDVALGHGASVHVAQHVLQHHPDGDRQLVAATNSLAK